MAVREELGRELLDPGASAAFAVSDHQIAHVYVARPEIVPQVKALLESLPGVERVLGDDAKRELGIAHPRSGELVAIADARSWFTYYYWFEDDRAPDFARTVEIHRKPGYDPAELFIDPAISLPSLSIFWRLLRSKLGFRALMNLVPLDADLVRGSHGRVTDNLEDGPVFIDSEPDVALKSTIRAVDVKDLIISRLFVLPERS